VTAYRRGAFQAATPLLERAVQLDSTFALALSWLVEANAWHQSTGDMGRVRHLAWQYRARLNPQDQLFLTLRLGSRYPRNTPFTDQIADAEKTVQRIPESADAWYYLGDVLFHGGRLSDIANPEARARQAFEAAFQRDSLYGAPITHLASLTFVAGDTAAQRLWTRREIALDSTAEGVPLAQWNLLQATGDGPGIKAFVASLATQGQLSQSLLNLGPLDSVTIAHQVELLDALPRLPTNGADRAGKAFTRLFVLLNRGRPAEAAAAIDTLRAMGVPHTNAVSVFVAFLQGGQLPDTLAFGGDRPSLDLFHFVQGDLSVIPRLREFFKALAATDTTDGFESRWLPTLDAWIAVKRGDTTANRLVDVADSLWQGRRENSQFGAGVLARLYQSQGRLDRALRAVRRRYITLGEPEPIGLAESFRLEGELAAKTGDKVGAIRAYRNYLRMRADPEPSRIPQRDSVRAELAAVGDLEGKQQ
jgi:tetratricopeptide (TPR) repeat protein